MNHVHAWISRYGLWAAGVILICACVLIANIFVAGRDLLQPSPLAWERAEYLPTPAGGCAGDVVRYGPVVLSVDVDDGRLFAGFQDTWVDLDSGAVLTGPDGEALSSPVVRVPFDAPTTITSTEVLTIPAMLDIPQRPGFKRTGIADYADSTGYTVPVEVRLCP